MTTHIYLDVDGVLANFVGGLERLYNKDITYWLENVDSKMSLRKILGFESTKHLLADVEIKEESFYEFLPRFRHSVDLIQYLAHLEETKGFTWSFLTTPSAVCYSFEQQRTNWITRLLTDSALGSFESLKPKSAPKIQFSDNKVEVLFNSKADRNILIDDHFENVQNFTKAGGLGLLFPAVTNDLSYLRQDPIPAIKIILDNL